MSLSASSGGPASRSRCRRRRGPRAPSTIAARRARRVLDRVARAGAQRRVGHPADVGLELARRAPARRRRGRSGRRARRRARPRGGASRTSAGAPRRAGRRRCRSRRPRRAPATAARRPRRRAAARRRRAGRRSRGSRVSPSRITHCTGKRSSSRSRSAVDVDGLEVLEQRRAAVPGHRSRSARRRCRRAARESGCRRCPRTDGSWSRNVRHVAHDRVEDLLGPVDEVHLVDRDHEVRDAEQRGDEGVAAGLLEHAVCARRRARWRGRRSRRR